MTRGSASIEADDRVIPFVLAAQLRRVYRSSWPAADRGDESMLIFIGGLPETASNPRWNR
jgi:hypothetical protein